MSSNIENYLKLNVTLFFRLNIEGSFFPALYMMMMRNGPRYGFWARCRRGWQVTKLGIKVVRADPELIVYMFFSAMFSIGAFVVLMTSTGGLGYFIGGGEEAVSYTHLTLPTKRIV